MLPTLVSLRAVVGMCDHFTAEHAAVYLTSNLLLSRALLPRRGRLSDALRFVVRHHALEHFLRKRIQYRLHNTARIRSRSVARLSLVFML